MLGFTISALSVVKARETGARSFAGSKPRFGKRCGFTVSAPLVPISRVCPSGALRTTFSVPMLPLEPVRFSTTTGWPRLSVSRSARMRAATSVAPPAGKGTTKRSGREGDHAAAAWARASEGAPRPAATASRMWRRRSMVCLRSSAVSTPSRGVPSSTAAPRPGLPSTSGATGLRIRRSRHSRPPPPWRGCAGCR